jgi:LysM repeat protein
MEYDNPQDKEETVEEVVEEELEEVNDEEEVETKKTTDVATETSDEDIVLDGSENTNENAPIAETPDQEVKTEKKKETKKKEVKKKETKEKEVKKSKGGSYKVKSGDNLGKIAEKYHIKVEALKKANNIKEDQINVGQDLKIPN